MTESQVFFHDYHHEGSITKGVLSLLDRLELFNDIKAGDRVAIKLHMGERGNYTYLRPAFVRIIVDYLMENGASPFITDTTTLYPFKRFTASDYLETAAINGFTEEAVGAPIVIADGDGYEGVEIKLKNSHIECGLNSTTIAAGIAKADFMLTLSHFKGHLLAGYGGAIKNLAMGCVTKSGKALQHAAAHPYLNPSLCNGCGKCVKVCNFKALKLLRGKAKQNMELCVHCNSCKFACPNAAYYWEDDFASHFMKLVAATAWGVHSFFKGKTAYLNFLQEMTLFCDCCAPAGSPVLEDIGILASRDPVALDKASADLVDKAHCCIEEQMPAPDRFGSYHKLNSAVTLETAQKLGCGSMRYKLLALA